MAVNVWQGVESGQKLVDNLFKQRDQMQAGRALATGDYGAAMRALGAGGDVQGVRQIQADQVQAQQRQRATQEEDTARQVAFTRQATAALRRAMTEGGDALATYDSMAPAFQQIGATPEQLQQYRQALAADPEGFLTNIERATAEAERKLSFQKAGDSLLVFEEGNPTPVNRFEAPRRAVVSGGVSFDPVTGQPIADARRPEYIEVEGADGQPQIVAVGPQGASVAFEGQAPRNKAGVLSADEVAAAGLAPGTVAQRTATGQISVIQAGPEAASRNRPTEAQNKDSFNANRMADSGAIISRLEREGFDFGASQLTGGQFREGGRSYDAAAREWTDSLIRLTSGAQAPPSEIDSAMRSYFPRPGDSAAVRQQKAARRRQVQADALARGQGGAADRSRGTSQPNQASSDPRSRNNVGTQENPIRLNPQSPRQSYNNIRSGQYYRDPNGVIRQKQ